MLLDGTYRVGLLGGSFNPPHEGHEHVTLEAYKRLRLDQVWWLVTPGNPLKDNGKLTLLKERVAASKALMGKYKFVHVTAIEAYLHTQYTVDTIRKLRRIYPHVQFIWLMGADNLECFHRWKKWRELMTEAPMAVFDRRPYSYVALKGPGAQWGSGLHASPEAMVANNSGWTYIRMKTHPASSTEIRGGNGKSGLVSPVSSPIA